MSSHGSEFRAVCIFNTQLERKDIMLCLSQRHQFKFNALGRHEVKVNALD